MSGRMEPATCAEALLAYAHMIDVPELAELDRSVDGAVTRGLFVLQIAMVFVTLGRLERKAEHKTRAESTRESFEKMFYSKFPIESVEDVRSLIEEMRVRVTKLLDEAKDPAAAREWWEELFARMTYSTDTTAQIEWSQGFKLWAYSSLELKDLRDLVTELVVHGKIIERERI